ncbi:MAG TPA: hypothetical protein VIM11_26785 [Tepidisphaeraceae bacterium]|jgi:hypothetical protein
MSSGLEFKLNELRHAENNLNAYIKHRWPIGAAITWKRGEHLQYGEVVDHSYDRRIKVVNLSSSTRYWIDCASVLDVPGSGGQPVLTHKKGE